MSLHSKKQKLDRSHVHYDLTDAIARFPSSISALQMLLATGLTPEVSALQPFLESILQSISHNSVEPIYQSSKLTLSLVIDKLSIDFIDDHPQYYWELTEDQVKYSTQKPLSSWAALAIDKLKHSPRLSKFRREPSARTLFDILLADRFDQLDDTEANCRLSVGYEVPMTANISEDRGGGKISGRADWSLGYMTELDKLEQMLVVIEAKTDVSSDRNMAQLLAYLHAIQEARVQSKKNSSAVFGVLTDSKLFRFVILRENSRVMASEPLQWTPRNTDVVAFLDNILLDAIKSSPHTTPQKTGNTTINRFDRHLQLTYSMPAVESNVTTDEDEDYDEAFDVVKIGGVSVLRPHEQ
ncbi:hypothetical protein GX50_07710 [[Emmonsia] crescens]|uniref:Uncharacterized protein n=1 Tax=[Emmonsia] crescens TaxID=73230 RepID=A0A2B7Z7Y9_9EURO|nr:hypothetical protein GX50_07710 [Emmonsia crescens]